MPQSDLVLAPETKPGEKKIQFDLYFSQFYLKKNNY